MLKMLVKPAEKVAQNILVLNYDPVFPDRGGKPMHEVMGWNDPHTLSEGYIHDLVECSQGYIHYTIAQWVDVDNFPPKMDGFRYTPATYTACQEGKQIWHNPDTVDYSAIFTEFGIPRRITAKEIDEVWLFGFPYGGFWESTMAGKNAYFCNSEPVKGIDTPRIFVTMGFNYERGVGEMLECFCHRAESIMWHVFGSWEHKPTHDWNRFSLYDKVAPGEAGCGKVHYAPNSDTDYDWGNQRIVWSTCDDWLNYPQLTGKRRQVNCAEWGNGDIRQHHIWWMKHLPHVAGRTKGYLNNWWAYLVDFNRFPESRK